MPLNETIETYGYLLKEAEKLDLAYFCFLRFTEDFDAVIEGRFLPLSVAPKTHFEMILYR